MSNYKYLTKNIIYTSRLNSFAQHRNFWLRRWVSLYSAHSITNGYFGDQKIQSNNLFCAFGNSWRSNICKSRCLHKIKKPQKADPSIYVIFIANFILNLKSINPTFSPALVLVLVYVMR